MGYRKLSARPRHHAQAVGAIEDFKKVFPRAWKKSGAKGVSIPAPWRFGSRTKRASARRTKSPGAGPGAAPPERPQKPAHRLGLYLWRDLPKAGQGRGARHAALDTEAMNWRLAEIATQIAPGAHAALLVDLSATLALSRRRLAPLWRARRAAQRHHRPAPRQMPRTELAGKRLAVHVRHVWTAPLVKGFP